MQGCWSLAESRVKYNPGPCARAATGCRRPGAETGRRAPGSGTAAAVPAGKESGRSRAGRAWPPAPRRTRSKEAVCSKEAVTRNGAALREAERHRFSDA